MSLLCVGSAKADTVRKARAGSSTASSVRAVAARSQQATTASP